MQISQALVLGIIQGITEFIPISSSGHLVALPVVFGWSKSPLYFDTTLHLGTVLALFVFFWRDLLVIGSAFFRDLKDKGFSFKNFSHEAKLVIYILIGIMPAGIVGFLFNGWFENSFRDIYSVMIFLIFGSALMFVVESFYPAVSAFFKFKEAKTNTAGKSRLTLLKSFVIGLFQALALFPGVSRSGSTISAGMLVGLDREKAARFSFLLSIPIIILAGTFEGITSLNQIQSGDVSILSLVVGFCSSFFVGFLCIKFLIKFLKDHGLYLFVIYRVILAVILFVILG